MGIKTVDSLGLANWRRNCRVKHFGYKKYQCFYDLLNKLRKYICQTDIGSFDQWQQEEDYLLQVDSSDCSNPESRWCYILARRPPPSFCSVHTLMLYCVVERLKFLWVVLSLTITSVGQMASQRVRGATNCSFSSDYTRHLVEAKCNMRGILIQSFTDPPLSIDVLKERPDKERFCFIKDFIVS